jgi:hypothetical protein
MLVIVNQYVDGSFIRRLLPSATFVQEGCHAQKKGVAPHRTRFVLEIQTEKSGIRTGWAATKVGRPILAAAGFSRLPVLPSPPGDIQAPTFS